jgi:branched-subunit amino acid aminotransferase/4-amino-4-deoxychorismate lyase
MTSVWRNGTLVPGDASPGAFPPGAALFETLAVRQGRVECLDDHLARLARGLDHLGLPRGPLAAGDLAAWRAAFAALGASDGVLRLVVGPGFEELGLRALLPSPDTFIIRNLFTTRDRPEWFPRPKAAPWANSLAATVELRRSGAGPGVEGIQLDARGCVSEGTRSSLAWIEDGELRLPDASTGRLPGTAQAQLAALAGLPVRVVAQPPPTRAAAVLLLRSTLPGGGAPVAAWHDDADRPFWTAADLSPARELLLRLAAHRAQRSVSLA